MKTSLAGGGVTPSLITMEGEYQEEYDYDNVAELLGMDEEDLELVGCGSLSGDDIRYLNYRYPEYMGIWPIIAKIGKAVVGAVPAIVKGVKRRRARRKAKKSGGGITPQMQAMIQKVKQQAVLRKQQLAKKENQKKLLMIGLPVAGLLVFMMLNKPRRDREYYPERGRYAIRSRR